jgi:hypothetical protein
MDLHCNPGYGSNLCGSHSVVFIAIQIALTQPNKTQVYSNLFGYLVIYAACFDLYLGHPQAFKYINLTKEDTCVVLD